MVTLIDVTMLTSRGSITTPYEQLLAPRVALVNIGFDDAQEPVFHTAHVRLENLLPWLGLGGIEYSGSIDGATSTASVSRTSDVAAEYNGWDITGRCRSGGFHPSHLQDASSVTAEVRAFLSVRPPEPLPYDGFNATLHALTDLLTFAADSPSGWLSRSLDYPLPDTDPRLIGGIASHDNAEALIRRVHQATPAGPVASQFLFTCRDLPFDVLVPRWLQFRQQAADACNILFGTLYARPTYTELRLLNIAIAAEALHAGLFPGVRPMSDADFTRLKAGALTGLDKPDRAWLHDRLHNEPTYVARLLHLAELPDETAVTTLIPDRASWAQQVKDARNGMAHRARPEVSTDALFELTEVSLYLLYLVLMQQLGLPGEVQRRALQQNQFLSIHRHERT